MTEMTDIEELEKAVIGDFIPLELIQVCSLDNKLTVFITWPLFSHVKKITRRKKRLTD